jgi:hypothetical protein
MRSKPNFKVWVGSVFAPIVTFPSFIPVGSINKGSNYRARAFIEASVLNFNEAQAREFEPI